jgi:hypothetical protein
MTSPDLAQVVWESGRIIAPLRWIGDSWSGAIESVPRAVATGLQFGDLDRRVVETRSLPLAVLTPLVLVLFVSFRVISWIILIKKPETKIASRILLTSPIACPILPTYLEISG